MTRDECTAWAVIRLLHGPLDLTPRRILGQMLHMLHHFYTFLCDLHFALERAEPLLSSPGGIGGWPGRSLAIAESICDVSDRLATSTRPATLQGDHQNIREALSPVNKIVTKSSLQDFATDIYS